MKSEEKREEVTITATRFFCELQPRDGAYDLVLTISGFPDTEDALEFSERLRVAMRELVEGSTIIDREKPN